MCVAQTKLRGVVSLRLPTLKGEKIIRFSKLPQASSQSIPQSLIHAHTLKLYNLDKGLQTHTCFTHMHSSHTTWLINSNLNDRGLTSYTHAFWWSLEKSLQHLCWARKAGRKSMNVKERKTEVMWMRDTWVTAGSCSPKFRQEALQLAAKCDSVKFWGF